MQLWFTCKNNELNGPFTNSEIKQMLTDNDLNNNDWLRSYEEENWQPLFEHPLAKQFIESDKTIDHTAEDLAKEWIVLRYIEKQYLQFGPYNTKDILQKIHAGQYSYNDFVWKPGYENWQRIGEVSNFLPNKPKTEAIKEDDIENKEEQLSLFQNTISYKLKSDANFYEEIPDEAISQEQKSEQTRFDLKKASSETFPAYYRPEKNKKRRWWFLSFFCLFLTLLIAIWGKNSLSLYL